ncbi:class I SAM-dependent methyltransferase [Ensifer canadensis]
MKSHIWDGYGRWDKIAESADISSIKRMITGDKVSWKPNFCSPALAYAFASVASLVEDAEGIPTVLDFGCGLGRNGKMLQRHFPRVVGVDLPEMIEKNRSHCQSRPYDALYGDLEQVLASEKVHVVYDSVVFQHFADVEYCEGLLLRLATVGTVDTFVTLRHGLIPEANSQVLNVLRPLGWRVIHSERDTLSFDGEPHELVILRRPS